MASRILRGWALTAVASLSLLAACGTSSTSTAITPKGPVKLAALCDNLTGSGAALTPTGSYQFAPTTDGDSMAITIPATAPQKIVAVTAVDSEIVAALGASDRLIGIDSYTNFPTDILSKPKVTDSTGKLNVEQIIALKPDLVLSYGGETSTLGDKQLRNAGINVVSLPTTDLNSTLGEILFAGKLIGATPQAQTLVARMEHCINAVKIAVKGKTPVTSYMELDDSTAGKPYAFGKGSFGDEIITDAGGKNIFADDADGAGFPQVSDETVIGDNPQVIILTEPAQYLASKPQDRAAWKAIAAVQNNRVYFANGDLLSRAGPRLVMGLASVAKAQWPDVFDYTVQQ